jgi:hypothetical protein
VSFRKGKEVLLRRRFAITKGRSIGLVPTNPRRVILLLFFIVGKFGIFVTTSYRTQVGTEY